jgi:cupin fold WbuC family metalloprotein
MLNAIEPGSYIRPHKHENPGKTEVIIVLQGKAAVFEFNGDGTVKDSIILDFLSGNYGAEISPGNWHCVAALEPCTVVYEMKEGPYIPDDDKIFPDWAPAENSPKASIFYESLLLRADEALRECECTYAFEAKAATADDAR